MNRQKKYTNRLINHLRKTYKNKLAAMAVIGIGIWSEAVTNDATFLVFALLIFGGLFFEKENIVG